MQQSQEQENADKENKGDEAEKQPPKKRKKDGKVNDCHSNTSNKENDNKNKEPKKAPSKSKSADKSNKETRKQLTNIANKKAEKAAENEASSHAAQDIYCIFTTTFPRGTHSKERCKETSQTSVVLDSGESDAEVEETDGDTADELPLGFLAGIPPNRRIIEGQHSLDQLTVISPHTLQEMSPVFPPRISDTGTSTRQLQELFPPTKRLSPSARSGTTLSETAEIVTQVMSSQLIGDDVYYQSGGFSDLLARPLGENTTQERRELISLQEENSRLHDEIAMLRSQLNSSLRNQPG